MSYPVIQSSSERGKLKIRKHFLDEFFRIRQYGLRQFLPFRFNSDEVLIHIGDFFN